MATCTKGFVLTSCKDAFFVCERIERAINSLIHPRIREELDAGRGLNHKAFTTCSMLMSPSSQAVWFVFTYEETTYTMSVNFSCDWDNREYGPSSISISLGLRKEAQRFIRAALESLALFGPVYFIADDSDDSVPAEALDFRAPSYLEACAAGEVLSSNIALNDWNQRWLRGEIIGEPGLPAAEIYDISQMLYEASCAAIQAHVDKYKAKLQPSASVVA
jgi:hypothetical protein